MADYEFPTELLAAQCAYYEADAAVRKLADKMPPSVAVLAGEVEPPTEKQQEDLAEARAKRLGLVMEMDGHKFWAGVDNWHAAKSALQAAAKAALQAAAKAKDAEE